MNFEYVLFSSFENNHLLIFLTTTKKMKKTLLLLCGALTIAQGAVLAQKCGMQAVHNHAIANDPSWRQRIDDQRASLQQAAENYDAQKADGSAQRTTATSAIPVIFHIVVNSSQLASLGGEAGIARRCDSQIKVLERDFNKANLDANLIPSSWKSLQGNAGIHFGLAHTDPSGHATPGYEIKIVSGAGFSNMDAAFPEAKTASTGLAAWDVTRYYNVWCINFTGSASSLLGIAVPKSMTSGWGAYPAEEMGVVIQYLTLGKQTTGAGTFNAPYNQGRTLTHETGHFFEIWHVWGDDGGACSFSGGQDDGIADTPPQADETFGAPAYTISGGTLNDACRMNGATNMQPIGYACLDFMDYTNDAAMYLFTPNQASAMASSVLPSTSENYTLTQHPALLNYPVAVAEINAGDIGLEIFPNPSMGQVNVAFSTTEILNNIEVMNMMGQQVAVAAGSGVSNYTIDLSAMSKGIYLVKCNFASGSVTRKILLQ